MSFDCFVSITEDARQHGVAGIIQVHENVLNGFDEPSLKKVLVSVVKGVLDVELPRKKSDPAERVIDCPIYLKDKSHRIAGVILKISDRKIGPADGARVVTISWDGRVIEYLNPDDWRRNLEGGDVE